MECGPSAILNHNPLHFIEGHVIAAPVVQTVSLVSIPIVKIHNEARCCFQNRNTRRTSFKAANRFSELAQDQRTRLPGAAAMRFDSIGKNVASSGHVRFAL